NKDNEQTHQLKFYHSMILSYLEEVVDILREASRDIRDQKRKLPKSVVEIIEDICKNLGIYYSTFYNFNKQKIVDINKHRHDVDKKIKDLPLSLDSYSVYVVSSLSRILHNISHMSAQTSIHNLQHVTEKED
ncbi:MAG: hypothetical protein Q8Q35_00160, partial [Nanoarchaeota archaeon]|nr:hypothetical protein [Nanoarchaeota archaeon]